MTQDQKMLLTEKLFVAVAALNQVCFYVEDMAARDYDFCDGWEHFIKCEWIVKDYNRSYAQCTCMEGDAPPEDVGGPAAFKTYLRSWGS